MVLGYKEEWQFKFFAILLSRTFLLLPSSHRAGFNHAKAGGVGCCCTFWRARAADGTTSIAFHHQKKRRKNEIHCLLSSAQRFGILMLQETRRRKKKYCAQTPGISIHNALDTVLSNNTSFSDYSLHVNNLIRRQAVAYTACSHWICISDCTVDKHVI